MLITLGSSKLYTAGPSNGHYLHLIFGTPNPRKTLTYLSSNGAISSEFMSPNGSVHTTNN